MPGLSDADLIKDVQLGAGEPACESLPYGYGQAFLFEAEHEDPVTDERFQRGASAHVDLFPVGS